MAETCARSAVCKESTVIGDFSALRKSKQPIASNLYPDLEDAAREEKVTLIENSRDDAERPAGENATPKVANDLENDSTCFSDNDDDDEDSYGSDNSCNQTTAVSVDSSSDENGNSSCDEDDDSSDCNDDDFEIVFANQPSS